MTEVRGFDGQVAIWDTITGRQSGRPLVVGGNRASAVFDPTDAPRMFAVTDTGQLTTWDRHDPEHPRQVGSTQYFAGGDAEGNPSFLTVSRDGRFIGAGDAVGGPVTVWDAHSRMRSWDLTLGGDQTQGGGIAGEFGSDAVTLPAANSDGVELYNLATGGHRSVSIPGGAQSVAALSPDGRQLAVMDRTRNVLLYDIRTRKSIGTPLKLHDNYVNALAFSPDGRLLISGGPSAEMWSIDRSLLPISVALPAPSGDDHPSSTLFLSGRDDIVTAGTHGELLRHDPATGRTLGPLFGGAMSSPVVASPKGRLLAAASSYSDAVEIWDQTSGRRISKLPGVPGNTPLAWSPTGHELATDIGQTLRLWDVSDPSRPRTEATVNIQGTTRPDYLLYADDHVIVAATASSQLVTAIDVPARHVKWSLVVPDFALHQVALSPDGKTIAVDSGDRSNGHVTLYDVGDGKRRQSVSLQSYGGVEYLHHGDWLIITGGDTEPAAQLYDAATLDPIGVPFSYPATGSSGDPIAVNRAGTMFSEAEYGAPLLWDVNPADWLTIACRIAGRNLTQAEWHQYLPSRPYQITCPQWPRGR